MTDADQMALPLPTYAGGTKAITMTPVVGRRMTRSVIAGVSSATAPEKSSTTTATIGPTIGNIHP
jgi:hypothetical protein